MTSSAAIFTTSDLVEGVSSTATSLANGCCCSVSARLGSLFGLQQLPILLSPSSFPSLPYRPYLRLFLISYCIKLFLGTSFFTLFWERGTALFRYGKFFDVYIENILFNLRGFKNKNGLFKPIINYKLG